MRVLVAQPTAVDSLSREGIMEHLDGVFALAPQWAVALARAASAGQWDTAAGYQQKLSNLLKVLVEAGVMPAFTAILNTMGIRGNFAPAPYRPLMPEQVERVLEE